MPWIVGDVGKCVAQIHLFGGVEARNVFFAKLTGAGKTDSEALDDWKTYLDSVYTPLQTHVQGSVQVYNYEAFLWDTIALEWVPQGSIAPSITNAASTSGLPQAVALLISATISGVKGIAKKYFCGLIDTDQTFGNWGSGLLADAATVALAYITPFGGIGGTDWEPGTFTKAKGWRVMLGVGLVRTLTSTQRRRKPGVGI
jgi:hypothetical protein